MAPRSLATRGASSKGKTIEAAEGTIPPPTANQPRNIEDSGSSLQQGPITGVQYPQQRENYFLQMLHKMKEQMKE